MCYNIVKEREVIKMKKTIYFIEYLNTIVFFQDGVKFEMIKNEDTYKQFQKIKNKYFFKNLLTN